MAKRAYKLQEFVAHSTNVNCLSIGKKAGRLFVTGGDDHKVNLWAIGKPTSLMSLCGHTSAVESVAFDNAEVLVLAGASTGVLKLWDLEESKMVRGLTGHRSNCTAVEFHPFGEFFASGSTDTNLKIWDIRKKGCIHTYKGHTRGISTIKFTPDGRWVVSGGFDNVVKVWDLTAGKLLHDFKFHEGHIRSIDFHPLEFLLATGSADRTVKFWDLETFELIGSARPEASGVRCISFHPDGRTLFCGLDDSLKVYSWEPVICHDTVDLGWSTLGDLCIHGGKLLGCSYYQNFVGVWVADLSLIEPHGSGFMPNEGSDDQKLDIPGSYSSDNVGNGLRSTIGLRSRSPDYEAKEIKNIYVDSASRNAAASLGVGSLSSPKVVLPLDSKETSNPPADKQNPIEEVTDKSSLPALSKSFVPPAVIPRNSPVEKDSSKSGREAISFSRTKPGMLLRPAHIRKPSNSKNDVDTLSVFMESETFGDISCEKGGMDKNLQTCSLSEDGAQQPCGEKATSIRSVTEKFEKVLSPDRPYNQENCDESIDYGKAVPSVKIVNGVAVVAGRTRTLVERFERRERAGNEDQAANVTQVVRETIRTPTVATNVTPSITPEVVRTPIAASIVTPVTPVIDRTPIIASTVTPCVKPEMDRTPVTASTVAPCVKPEMDGTPVTASTVTPCVKPEMDGTPVTACNVTPCVNPAMDRPITAANVIPRVKPEIDRTSVRVSSRAARVTYKMDRTPTITPCVIPDRDRPPPPFATNMTPSIIPEMYAMPPMQEEPQISGRDLTTANYKDVTEDLMQSHEVFLSTLKSRLTKLQVVRHFWERNDIKGAINALRKLPDHSVHADVISVLMEKMEILTLDIFSGLLPVLVGLLDSKMERHANVSLEMLLKLVAVFGPVIHSAVVAPPAVGVDLHAEQRIECCRRCFTQLQKIQQILPALISKGGSLAKHAQELNLVLLQ